jgi:hypothetical protein
MPTIYKLSIKLDNTYAYLLFNNSLGLSKRLTILHGFNVT